MTKSYKTIPLLLLTSFLLSGIVQAETAYVKTRKATLYDDNNQPILGLYVPTALNVITRENGRVKASLDGRILKNDTESVDETSIILKKETPKFLWGEGNQGYYYESKGRISQYNIRNKSAFSYDINDKNDYVNVKIEGWVSTNELTDNIGETKKQGTVRGKILNNGKPAEGVTIIIQKIWKKTDAEGAYIFENLDPGKEYILSIVRDEKSPMRYINLKNLPVLDPGEILEYEPVDIVSLGEDKNMAMEVIYDHGYVTVKGEISKQLPKFYEYMSDMGFVISGVLKKMGPPKKDEDIEDLKKYIQGEKTALVPEARINEKGNYTVTAPKNPNESKGRIALLIFREKDAVKFFGTLKPIKLLASQNIGKKINIFNEDKKENRAVLEDYGYTLEKTGSEGNDICYKVLPSSNRYKDVPYPNELTDVFDFYVRSVLSNKGYEILDFTPYRYSLEESSYREILDRAKELGVNYLCVINYAALSEWKGRGMSWNSSYYWTFGIGAYVVCNISVFNMMDASDKYDTIFYGITPFKWMVEKSEKSACLISTKPDTDISEIKNENANFFVFSNRAIRKEIVNQESKNVAGYAGEDDSRPESLKYKLLHMLKQ